jgi:hypothetical protein
VLPRLATFSATIPTLPVSVPVSGRLVSGPGSVSALFPRGYSAGGGEPAQAV